MTFLKIIIILNALGSFAVKLLILPAYLSYFSLVKKAFFVLNVHEFPCINSIYGAGLL
jgi:hypothetical protein